MNEMTCTGWDVGGAHLKAARVGPEGRLLGVVQVHCPLWRGPEQLDRALDAAAARLGGLEGVHAVTMTGELADCFAGRADGVRGIVARMCERLKAQPEPRFFAVPGQLLTPAEACARPLQVASANWCASASLVARHLPDAVLMDVGSTTTDIVGIRRSAVEARGWTDAERLRSGELHYGGVVRTPVAAVADSAPFAGEWQGLAAEHFANMADVYRLAGALPADADLGETADRAGKTEHDSARRLARMLGRDLESAELEPWRGVAGFLARTQRTALLRNLERLLSRDSRYRRAPLVGAGAGRFLVRELATQLGQEYVEFSALVDAAPGLDEPAAVCAPAAALAYLAMDGQR